MSVIKCNGCHKDIDTDIKDTVCFNNKYYFCDNCLDNDELFEILDELQAELDKIRRLYAGSVKALVNANGELRAIHDAARQGCDRCGIPRD